MRIRWTNKRPCRFCTSLFALGVAALLSPAQAQQKEPVITVSATHHAYHNAPVTVELPLKSAAQKNMLGGYLQLNPVGNGGGKALRAQASADAKTARLTFIMDDLPKGEARNYRLSHIVFVRKPDGQVELTRKPDGVEVSFDTTLFTRYTTSKAPNKPIFYPILTPNGDPLTRQWLVEPDANPQESHDHPHHRGLWFTHSSVNGVDFWGEDKKAGKTVPTSFEAIQSGWVYGSFRTRTDWITPDAKKIATDTRDVTIMLLPNGDRVLDFSITIKPEGAPLVFGDNKDGMFGLRVPDSMALVADKSSKIKADGQIETASGHSGKAAWGKPNNWVDYWGPVGGQTYGVAIFDSSQNLRHPETWHARDYGLFTVNPFGLHDFGLGDKGAGDYTVPADKTLSFTYRVLFHKGDTRSAGIADQYAAFADPPEVKVKW